MFLPRRPSSADIDRFLGASRDLPLSYDPVGIAAQPPSRRRFDEQVVRIGRGAGDCGRARDALMAWRHFDIGWVELFRERARPEVGATVAILIRHVGLWSLNGARVVYTVESGEARFGFAYGTLTNHAESGEELFEVFVEPRTGDVMYRIRAVAQPQATAARLGLPVVRLLQSRFRRDSAAALRRATHALS
jgi:uncharacterized protein (UPF0548 family)